MPSSLISSVALANSAKRESKSETTCKVELPKGYGSGDYNGTLTLNKVKYKCTMITLSGISRSFCAKKGTEKNAYEYVIGYDGAEGDFGVYEDFDLDQSVCKGQAN